MIAGWPLVKASRQGPAARVSWWSSRAWASGSDALARAAGRRHREHRADGVHPEQLFGRDHDQVQGAGQVGHRVQVGEGARLLTSVAGSIGMACRCSGRRTGEPGQQARHDQGPGADQANSPRCVGSSRSRRRHNEDQPISISPQATIENVDRRGRRQVLMLMIVLMSLATAGAGACRPAGRPAQPRRSSPSTRRRTGAGRAAFIRIG
jgi:hypothetical protein